APGPAGPPPDPFLFAGFLPPKTAARQKRLAGLKGIAATLVFYESPHRLAESLADMAAVLGDRKAAVARELTKTFEEVRRGGLESLAAAYADAPTPKGEIAVVVAPPDETAPEAADVDALLLGLIPEKGVKGAADEAAALTGLSRRDLYRRALELKDDG
ncbi:MAG TPA: rRNA (cytidine-2'-O-)-methyltransferase, partial [Bauldia sp.]|nr:rRNA (cytidine-2'-O-)-methyltransferase [Bauldia sp.]